MKPFTLAIVGRPNVGKSTLFNRLAGRQLAIVDDRPGITRDWREAEGAILGVPIRIIDTAGLEESFDQSMEGKMRRQTEAALREADVVLFLLDGRAGVTPLDEHFARWLRKQKIPVLLGVNKAESEKAVAATVGEAHGLGLGDPIPLSAEHGEGLEDLFDMLEPYLPPEPEETADSGEDQEDWAVLDALEGDESFEFKDNAPGIDPDNPLKLAIVDRPNVGKSTLMNALLGEERVITSPEAGTTRDSIAARWDYKGQPFRLVDTAGMRRRARITDRVEKLSVDDSLRAIRLAQIVVLVVDAQMPLEKQDMTIAQHVADEGRALIIAINKWDLIENRSEILQDIAHRLKHSLSQLPEVPVITMSALTGRNLNGMMDAALKLYQTWNARVPTARLNQWLGWMESRHPAPAAHGRPNRCKFITQVKTRPPTFALWAARPHDLPDDYKRYLVNGLRAEYGLPGVPVRLHVRASKNPYV